MKETTTCVQHEAVFLHACMHACRTHIWQAGSQVSFEHVGRPTLGCNRLQHLVSIAADLHSDLLQAARCGDVVLGWWGGGVRHEGTKQQAASVGRAARGGWRQGCGDLISGDVDERGVTPRARREVNDRGSGVVVLYGDSQERRAIGVAQRCVRRLVLLRPCGREGAVADGAVHMDMVREEVEGASSTT